jgi:histidine triad (HIT) family protein
MADKTLFQKIMDGELEGDIVYEDDSCAVLRDVNPQAPTHLLVVPRKPIASLDALTEEDEPLVGHLFVVARKVAAEEDLNNGYRTVFNNGESPPSARARWPPAILASGLSVLQCRCKTRYQHTAVSAQQKQKYGRPPWVTRSRPREADSSRQADR